MTVTKCKIDFGTVVGTIGKEIFGSFVEHFGRCVYTGIYQNDHVLADAFGFRGDVKEAVKRLGVSLLRCRAEILFPVMIGKTGSARSPNADRGPISLGCRLSPI